MIRSEHMKSCFPAQIRFLLFKGPGSFQKKFKIGGNVDELKTYRLIPLTPTLLFHFTLPLRDTVLISLKILMSCLTGTEAPQSVGPSSCDNSGPPPCSCLSSCMNWSVNQIIYPFTLTFSVADLESMGSLNLSLDPAKMTHKNKKKYKISFLKCWILSFVGWRLLL